MVLNFSPAPEFYTCATKVFEPEELHITRVYNKSVLILMMDGILRFRENNVDVELKAGDYYIQRSGLLQEGVRLGEMPIYFYVEFDGSYSSGPNGLALRGTFQAKSILGTMERFEELFRSHKTNLFLMNSYMHRIFSELLTDTPTSDDKANVAYLVKNFIDSRYSTLLSLEDLSQKFGYDEDYIVRIFKNTYGVTPHKYLISVRMEHARWLLENTSLTADQTASAVGYGDFSSFFRSFRKTYGVSPGIIREKKHKRGSKK